LTECTATNKQISNATLLSLGAQICALMHSHLFRIRGSYFFVFLNRRTFLLHGCTALTQYFCMCNALSLRNLQLTVSARHSHRGFWLFGELANHKWCVRIT